MLMPDAPNIDPRLRDVRVIASVSGGKDSAAMCLHLRELGIPFDAVFMDTGWEHRDTYAYLRGPLEAAIGPIRWLRAEVELPPEKEAMAQELEAMLGHYSTMVRTCLKKAVFPARTLRWCTSETKVLPMQRWLATLDEDTVSVVGIRADESAARAAMAEWEWSDKLDQWTWRPLLRWSLDDVIAIHARHGLGPNPLYLAGASRVGCWPCIFARKAEIRLVADTDPARVGVLRLLEQRVAELCEQRNADTYLAATWFQHNSERQPEMKDIGYAWPIDRVVEWSRTSRGGRQVELFAAPQRDTGCMRWGLCDVGTAGED
jgi:3'-phosphoadenosine 5'-phosphosulfate sulfotransferase (PAPS reductase)/FAD synthetase